MSFKTATDNFESALQIAESLDDSFKENLAQGLIELTKAIKLELRNADSKVEALSSKINSLR